MNCFPSDSTEEPEKTEPTVEEPEAESAVPAGTSQVEGGSKPLTKLDRKKVDEVWTQVRGESERPSDDFIMKAIKKDDFDGSGELEKGECKRLCESFQLRAKKNGDIFENWERVFEFLDKNGDDTLDFEDIRYTMTVMWLMTKDRVSLQRLTECADEAATESKGETAEATAEKAPEGETSAEPEATQV